MHKDYYKQYQKVFENFIDQALKEDLKEGDLTSLSCIDPHAQSKAQLIFKEGGILAGLKLARKICKRHDPQLKVIPFVREGAYLNPGVIAFTVKGSTRSLLAVERLVLNTLQRMSGIASRTHELTQKIKHTSCKLLDTRKTTPNFRYPEKWAVQIGGGINHRMGLFDAIMIKDNHIDFCGGMDNTLLKTEKFLKNTSKTPEVVVECRNPEEITTALKFSWINRILLDNHSIAELKNAVALIDNRMMTEASGNITSLEILLHLMWLMWQKLE
ncbi:MAG: carboxylating nicotinate-nucleotide diphosphorylase [Flavobacteriaceae bacterium]